MPSLVTGNEYAFVNLQANLANDNRTTGFLEEDKVKTGFECFRTGHCVVVYLVVTVAAVGV